MVRVYCAIPMVRRLACSTRSRSTPQRCPRTRPMGTSARPPRSSRTYAAPRQITLGSRITSSTATIPRRSRSKGYRRRAGMPRSRPPWRTRCICRAMSSLASASGRNRSRPMSQTTSRCGPVPSRALVRGAFERDGSWDIRPNLATQTARTVRTRPSLVIECPARECPASLNGYRYLVRDLRTGDDPARDQTGSARRFPASRLRPR
jgi:hypothetical protein